MGIKLDRRTAQQTTYVGVGIDDVNQAAHDDDEIENVPRIAEVILQQIHFTRLQTKRQMTGATYFESISGQFQDELHGEHGGEDHVQNVQSVRVNLRLAVEFHGQGDGVGQDEREEEILERLRSDQPPDLVLEPLLGDVAAERFGF